MCAPHDAESCDNVWSNEFDWFAATFMAIFRRFRVPFAFDKTGWIYYCIGNKTLMEVIDWLLIKTVLMTLHSAAYKIIAGYFLVSYPFDCRVAGKCTHINASTMHMNGWAFMGNWWIALNNIQNFSIDVSVAPAHTLWRYIDSNNVGFLFFYCGFFVLALFILHYYYDYW